MRLLRLAAFLCTAAAPLTATPLAAHGDAPDRVARLQIELSDGSVIKARAGGDQLRIIPVVGEGEISLKWMLIESLENDLENSSGTVFFANGDKLTFRWAVQALKVEAIIGRLRIPAARISGIEILGEEVVLTNVALGKPVSGQDGASHGKGLAKHVTDGNYDTHAKPPAFGFDYRIDLQDGSTDQFSVQRIKIHWGRFGDRFVGIANENGVGWAPAAWPGDYVTSYHVEYRPTGSDEWSSLHEFGGRPADEDASDVTVERLPTELPGCSSEVMTTITGLDLQGVAEIRIRAKGGHWIGLHELEVFGHS